MIRRAPINQWLATGGRPQLNNTLADVVATLQKDGMSERLALALANLIHDARNGYDWKVARDAGIVEREMRAAHAERHPQGKWARLIKRYGPSAIYMDDDSPEARAWANGPLKLGDEMRECSPPSKLQFNPRS